MMLKKLFAWNMENGLNVPKKAHLWGVSADGQFGLDLCLNVGKWEVIIPREYIKEELSLQEINVAKPSVIELGPVVERPKVDVFGESEKCGILCEGLDGTTSRKPCDLPKGHWSLLHRHPRLGDTFGDQSKYFVWD